MQPPKPDNEIPSGMVENTDPITCKDFDQSFSTPFSPSSFLENDAKCDAVRSVGKMFCGCSTPCRFCGEGYRISNPTQPVGDMQNLLDSIIGPFEEEDEGPTCRDVFNAAATASALYSVSANVASTLDYGIDSEIANSVDEEYICDLYRSAFASECDCIRLSTPKNARHGCNICDNNEYANPNQTVQVLVDGTSIGTTCANVDTFALLGLDVCSEITERHCPCDDTFPTISNSITVAADESVSSAETQFDAVGVSLAVSTMIVIVASIL